ncbi:hypothetical protein HAX54_037326 [Datura stramonium]|uniref:Uncharacterized protein n=1 Tax=Datura stramonium TaxID=4076 RepID=A0ABS8RGY3_DATST|nr:hypothetical protein [Datura stramonium]
MKTPCVDIGHHKEHLEEGNAGGKDHLKRSKHGDSVSSLPRHVGSGRPQVYYLEGKPQGPASDESMSQGTNISLANPEPLYDQATNSACLTRSFSLTIAYLSVGAIHNDSHPATNQPRA